jgi:hypothetical protein
LEHIETLQLGVNFLGRVFSITEHVTVLDRQVFEFFEEFEILILEIDMLFYVSILSLWK